MNETNPLHILPIQIEHCDGYPKQNEQCVTGLGIGWTQVKASDKDILWALSKEGALFPYEITRICRLEDGIYYIEMDKTYDTRKWGYDQ